MICMFVENKLSNFVADPSALSVRKVAMTQDLLIATTYLKQ